MGVSPERIRAERETEMENEDIGAKDFRFSFGVMAVIGIIAIGMMLFSYSLRPPAAGWSNRGARI